MNNLRSYAKLTFLTRNSGSLLLNSASANNCILAVNTCKEISNPNGTFTIVLSPRIAKQLAIERGTAVISDVIRPYDLVQIEFKTGDANQPDYKVEMIGIVSRAFIELAVGGNGAPQRVIKIVGFDMGFALKNFKIFFNPYVGGDTLGTGQQYGPDIYWGTNTSVFDNMNPIQFVQKFLNIAFSSVGPGQPFYPLKFPNGLNFQSYMDFVTGISTAFANNTMSDPYILTNIGLDKEVSVYDIVKSYSDIPFHEVFMDLRRPGTDATGYTWTVEEAEKTHQFNPPLPSTTTNNQQPYVFNMRTAPFSPQNWAALNTHYFYTSDVLNENLGTSEDNIYNYYEVLCERQSIIMGDDQKSFLSGTANVGGVSRFPIIDTDSIENYGFKKFPFTTTKYVEFVTSTNVTTEQSVNPQVVLKQTMTLNRQLFRWYAFGEDFESGVVVLKGRVGVGPNGITMGSRLLERNPNGTFTGKQFYIESVMQDFAVGNSLKTTVALTRGHYPFNWVDSQGNTQLGRFDKVINLEKELSIDQASAESFFNPIDPEDFNNTGTL
jgi:hypothetical protein